MSSYCDELGHSSIISLFSSIPDTVKIKGSPYEPEKALIYPVVGEAIEHQIGIIKETEARKEKEKSNVIWKGKGLVSIIYSVPYGYSNS